MTSEQSFELADLAAGGRRPSGRPKELPMPIVSYVTIPSDDDEFRSTVEQLVAQTDDLDRLRDRIVALYPKAYVSAQSPLGSLSGEPTRTYIYRDGFLARNER